MERGSAGLEDEGGESVAEESCLMDQCALVPDQVMNPAHRSTSRSLARC